MRREILLKLTIIVGCLTAAFMAFGYVSQREPEAKYMQAIEANQDALGLRNGGLN